MYAVGCFVKSHKALLDACEERRLEDIPELASILEEDKIALLEEKERQGYTDGLSFLEDNTYIGFKVVNGRFIGDDISAYKYGCECAANFRKGAYANVFYELALFILVNVDVEKARRSLHGNTRERGRQRAA